MTRFTRDVALRTDPCDGYIAEISGTACRSIRLLQGYQPQAILHELIKNSKLVLPGAATAVGGTSSPTSSVQVVGVTNGAAGLAIVPDSVPVLPEAFCARSVSSLRVWLPPLKFGFLAQGWFVYGN